MNKKLNPIRVSGGKGKVIAKAFRCTPARVSQALNGKFDTELTRKIRHVALSEYDGIEMVPVKQTEKTE